MNTALAREVFEHDYLIAQISRFSAISLAPLNSWAWNAPPTIFCIAAVDPPFSA